MVETSVEIEDEEREGGAETVSTAPLLICCE